MPLERIQPSVAFEPEPTTRACWQGTMDGSGSGGAGSSTSSASGMSPTHSGLQGGSGDALEGGRGMAPTSSVYASKYGSSNNSSSHSTAEDGYGHGCSYGYSHASGFGSGSGYGASSSLSMTPSSLPISGSTSPALSQHSSTGSFVDNSKGNIKGSSSSSSSSRSNSYLLRPDADSTRASSSACRSASSPHRPSRGDISGQDRQASFSFGFSELGTGWRSAHAPHQGSMDTIVQNQAPATPLADGEHGGKEQEERYLEQKRVAIPQAALHSHSALPLAVPPNEEGNTKLHAPLTPEGHSRFLLSDFAIGKTSNANARASRPSTAPSDPTAHPSLCSPPSPPMPPLPHRFAARQQEELAESRIGRAMMTGTLSTATTSSDEEGSRRRGRRRSSLFLDNYDDGRGQEDKNECYLGSGPPSPAPEEGWGGSGGGEDGHMHHAHEHGRSAAMRRLDEGGGSQNQSLDLLGRFGFTGRFAVSPALLSPTTPSEEKRGTAVDAQARRETDEQEEKDTDPLAQFDVRRTSGSQARAGADGSSAHQSWTSFSAPQPQARQRSASNAQVSSGIVNGPKQRDSISALREAGSPSASGSGAGALGRAGSWGRAAGIASIGSPRVRQGGIDVLADVDPLASFAAFAGSASLSKAGRASAAADAHDPALPSHVPASVGASSLQKQLQQQQAQDISGTGQKGNERKDKQQQQPQHASRPAVAHRSSGGSVNSHMSLLSQAHSDSSTASATSAGTASTALTRPGSRLSGDSISSIGISALSQSLLHTISPQQQQPKSATTSASAGSSVAAPTVPSSRHPNSGVVLVEDSSVRGERSTEKRSSRSSNAVSDTASGDTLAPALSDSPIKQRGGEEAQEVIEHAANQPALADFASPSTKLSRPSIDTCMLSTPNARSLRDSACSASPHQAGAEAASTPSPDSLSLSPNSDSLHRSPSTNASMTPTASHGLGLSEAVKLLMSPPSARVDDAASTVRQPLFDSTAQSGPLPSHTASADSLTGLSAEQLPLPSPSPSSLPQGLPARTTEGVGEHVQRRHTGVFLSRTRSQMLSQPDLFTAFSGAGGGRAAARAKAMQPVNFDNAPFSVLEARAKVMATSSQSTAMSGAELSSGPSAKWTRATTSLRHLLLSAMRQPA
ncbi:hypothetical protein K437DRAFT_160764 [Tilletiaria anomala UBC 951]|uniref:Uncharacterized protein n=1 Tax=Tilletiaria anomala (strain ATCC 24038 / CBS 436.72 / UBC 951) TaxID=1037660 RepID=A0A066VLA0_TILAU|nr:uncharacterized protein K437DRAFT_160764 [Tilletiaria anomala UBC 951]KDN42512.1 hypothetical protein K437DRAFT_160764 [Tilletiaria anomala UBC 951]